MCEHYLGALFGALFWYEVSTIGGGGGAPDAPAFAKPITPSNTVWVKVPPGCHTAGEARAMGRSSSNKQGENQRMSMRSLGLEFL